METNLSDYISSEVLTQLDNNKLLHLIVFFLKNWNFIKYNYKIYDKKR